MDQSGKANAQSSAAAYRSAGVDIEAGEALVRRIAPACKATGRPELLTGLGGFAALSRLPKGYREPVLVSGTDGVGTKLRLAIEQDAHDHIGQDLVAMCVNDVLVTGAEPLLFLDYYATGQLQVTVAERVIKGIARACEIAGCSLAGGETAEMPGHYAPGDYDLAGFCIGIAEESRLLDGSRIQVGDRLLGVASSGAHANGFSLIRKLLDDGADTPIQRPTSAELLAPTKLYTKAVRSLGLAAASNHEPLVCGMAHITGGGLTDNVPRMFNGRALDAQIHLDRWPLPTLFRWLQARGELTDETLTRTFNCGLGLVLAVAPGQHQDAAARLKAVGEHVFEIGAVTAGTGTVRYHGGLRGDDA